MKDAFGNQRMTPQAVKPLAAKPLIDLSTAVVRGKVKKPTRVLMYGVHGVGKTSWAACAPDPIIIDLERGSVQLDVARLFADSWSGTLDLIRALIAQEHAYKTLVIDTADFLEQLCWRYICARDRQANIESYGYGKGYKVALKEWREFRTLLTELSEKRGMGVIVLAHSQTKSFKNPEGADFDRYEMTMHNGAASMLKDWCDTVLFARYETIAHEDQQTKRVRGLSSGARLVHTQRTAAYDAKNRYDLPATLSLDYAAFAEAIELARPDDPEQLTKSINALLEQVTNAELKATVVARTAAAAGNPAQLVRILDRLSAVINIEAAQQQQQEPAQQEEGVE